MAWDELGGEQGPACAGLVGRNLGFILIAGCDSVPFVCLDISGCCCVRHGLRGHTGGSRYTGHRLVLDKHLWSTYCIQGTALSRQPWPLAPSSSSLLREMDMTHDTGNQEQQGRSGVLLQT